MRCAYMVFDITDDNIDKHISNITIENRAVSGLNNLGYSQIGKYKIKKEWRDKIVVFFAYFDKQEKTPYFKVSFITKPILIIDAGNSGAIPLQYEREYKRIDIIFDIIQGLKRMITANVYLVQLQENAKINMSLEQRTQIANTIKHNTQSKRILFLSLHIDSESSEQISGMRCFYNDKAYKKEEERFIERLKQVNQTLNNDNFAHKGNMYINKFANMPSVLITLGFISNHKDRENFKQQSYRASITNKLFLAISNYIRDIE
ncbi:hypothetical protein CQA53_11350 [Helicobacter didelphidarum]|uniref:N-acetylmuramoyl-L-alanine amidase n=1 Tax=Helicobacter didelphidarum TaxID=2040648 RepID=A0A3D8I4V9_9HELI|nr:N-acetylmuramoyl-L-alanine amidase [Helicobacter didelphidarum]RDU59591.1 hypothetical protein CQA53_11350 [Helicobacter didelphidarum]